MKMLHVGMMIRLQRHEKIFPLHYSLWGGDFLKLIVTYFYYTEYNEVNMRHSDVRKHVSSKKGINSINIFVYRLYKKVLRYITENGEKFLKRIFTYFY